MKRDGERQMEERQPLVLFGAGDIGRRAASFYGAQNILYVVDNFKAGQYVNDIPVITPDELKGTGYTGPIVIATTPNLVPEIADQLKGMGYCSFRSFIDLDDAAMYRPNPHLERFENCHAGKRCFLIGNGPSLRADDLDTLHRHGELSFASNAIYKLFDETCWRPSYFMATDDLFITQHWDRITAFPEDITCLMRAAPEITPQMYGQIGDRNNFFFFIERLLQFDSHRKAVILKYEQSKESFPAFSACPQRFVYTGLTNVYGATQWAAYMGFTELYLLGVDLAYNRTADAQKLSVPQRFSHGTDEDHLVENYRAPDELYYLPDVNLMGQAFEAAEAYSREHGFRIYNATRGGKLEAFERVDFDSLFPN